MSARLLTRSLLDRSRPQLEGHFAAAAVALVIVLMTGLRTSDRLIWAAFSLVPLALTIVVGHLAHAPAAATARVAHRHWNRCWRRLVRSVRRLERRYCAAVMAHTDATVRIAGDVVAIDQLSRNGQLSPTELQAASVVCAATTMERLGVLGTSSLAAASATLSRLSNALSTERERQELTL